MRCREALKRLNRLDSDSITDRELLEHLRQCSRCAHELKAARELARAFGQMAEPDRTDSISWPEQIRRVEAAAQGTQKPSTEKSTMSRIKRQIGLRPRLSLSLAAAALVLVAGTLIPMKFDRTVGFEVAVAGVDRDLALNRDKLDEMLVRLGLDDVHVTVEGCDLTCNLRVSDIKSSDDARLLKVAFEKIGDQEVRIELKPVNEEVSESAFNYATQRVFTISATGGGADSKLEEMVIERLGEDFTGEGVFFHSSDGQFYEVSGLDSAGVKHDLAWFSTNDTDSDLAGLRIEFEDSGRPVGPLGLVAEETDPDKRIQWHVQSDEPNGGMLVGPDDVVNGRLTDEAVAALEAEGYRVEQTDLGDNRVSIKLITGSGDDLEIFEFRLRTDHVSSAEKQAELPSGYELSQNYPNPFNPTTKIDFEIPRAENVKLEIFNINGQKVRTLVDEIMPAGRHTVQWDATSDGGDRVASGVYLYRLQAAGQSVSKKMTLLK